MADNPFDAFDDSARPATASNPFDALDDDAVVQKRVAENPDLQAVMSRFARSRVDDISATARRVPDPEAFTSLDERTRGKAVQGELQAAEEVDQRAQAAVRDAQARGDSATYGAAVEAASEAGRRLAQARKLDEDNRAGIVRQASPEQQLAIGNAIAAQKKRIDYLNDQIEQADSNPAFLPEGRRIEDVRADLQREMQALYKLEAGRGYGEQRQAFADPSAVGEFGRGVARGALGTVPEMLGGAAKQAGADGVADVLRDFGRGVRRDTAAEAAGEILKLGEKESFGKDLKNFVSAKFGEGLGTSLPIIAAYMAGGPAGTVTGVSASAALGIGQMRNSLEDAFAEQGIAFPEEHAARYVYLYGTAIGALESLTEVTGMRALTGDAKRQAVRSIGRALASGAARGAAMEGVTEALQEAVELYGVADATGKPLDYAELRRRMTEGFAAGAVPGAAFGAFTGAASNKAAFDLALEKAKELGFGDKPAIGANESEKTADAAPLEPAAAPQQTAEQPAPADAVPAVVVDPVAVEQTGTAALDVVDSLIPDGTEVDREMAGEAAAVAGGALGLDVADPAEEAAAAQQAADVDAEEQADATTLDAYLAEGGSLSRSALPTLARRMGVTEADLPALLDKAVDVGTLRKTAGGMYRRAAAEPQATPSEFRQAERQRRAMEAIDEALNFGRQILPKDVTIEVADSLNVGGYELDALSDSTTGRIALAVYANNPRARIGHEGLHTLVTRGHVSPGELAILAETARTSGVWTAKAEAQYRDAYAGRANLDGLIAEEAAAHLVEARIRGQDFGQQANAIIEKIKKVLQRIRKALQGRGFKTADDVIDALMSGEMARREARAEWMRDAQAEARQLMQARARQGVELPGGVRVQGVPLFAIRAFHGSPHDFDHFSIDKIGSGEGAQVYGRGLYFAESEDIARWYRDSVADKHEDRNYTYDRTNWRDVLRVEVRSVGGDRQKAIKALEYEWRKWGYANPQNSLQRYRAEAMSEAISRLKNPNFDLSKFAPPPRRLYEVRIDIDPEQQILDWDAPLSEQNSAVRALAQRYRADLNMRGGDFYARIGKSEDATRVFVDAGISGVKYLDASSRRRGNGTRNFVVFDDTLIRIVSKDGVPVVRDDAMFAIADAHTGRAMRSDIDALGFYSAGLRAARAWPQTKGTPEQALTWLKKSGVKEGEIEATGLAKVIEGQKAVTRDEIVAHLEKNRVGLNEVRYGEPPKELAGAEAKIDEMISSGSYDPYELRDLRDQAFNIEQKTPRTKWSSYSLDPGNPSYRETVLHLPGKETIEEYAKRMGIALTPATRRIVESSRGMDTRVDFNGGHFPEPNITGHMMTSMVRDADGRPVYLIDQIQSDWGQKLRDGGVRDEAKIAELKRRAADAEQAYIATPSGANWLARVQQISKAAGLAEPSTYKDAYANLTAILNRRDHMQDTARSIHRASADDPAAADFRRLYAEAATAEAATPGHPLVNTTDQWVNTTLRRALMQAAEADAEFIAIPSGKTVESYNPQGDSAGNAVFYDQIVPKNLRNLLRKLDKQSPDPVRVAELETPTQGMKGEGFAVFEITPEVKRRVIEDGQALFGLSDIARRFLPSRNEPLAGINSIVRDLAHDLGITVRQGLTTPAAKTAKRQARRAGTDISSYFDPATGVLRVTSMSDLTAILTHAGEAIIRRYDAAKGRVNERGARDVMNPLERLISRHAFGLLGTYRGKLFGQIEPKYSGMHLAPVLRETLTQYLQAWHNANVATMNRSRDPGGYAKAQRELTNAQRMVARYMGRKLTDAIAMEKASVTSVWGLVQGKVDIAEIRDYVDIRYNQHSKIKPPPPADPLDRETQRAAFGKWFTTYISDRPAAEAQDPALFEAFEDLIDTTDPVLSAKLDDASDAIAAYAKAEPVQIVTSMISSPKRFGNIASFFQNIDRDGLLPTLADGARMLYRGGWDDLHPWYTAVRQLLETHRVNSGVKIDLDAADNAYKLLRLGRHSGAWAGRDLEDGIKARASNAPEGPSLVQALQMALGSDRATALDMGQDGRYAQFNAYLIARRAVRLWDRFYDGTLPNPPLNASRETAVATIQKLEGEFPSFVGAADMVYEFQTNLLKLQRDAGILTPETFETLAKEPDYVPFIRDMTDKDEASSRVLRGAQSIIRKIKGSDRNIMDPIATIAQKVYETRQIIATNDAKLALLKLAEAAGPGGGAIAERLDPNTSKAMRVNLKDALRSAADEMGVSRADANALVDIAQELLGDQMTGTVFGKGQLNTTGQNITWVYENGIPVPIKLADGDLGNLMMQTLQTFGTETTNIIVEMMAVPAAITRSTVTSHPSFILRNGFVDGLMAWMYDRQATPWVTQAKGFVAGLMETEKVRAYARSAGLMGGPSTSALDRLRFDRDVRDLVARGYQPKVWESPAAFIGELVRHPIRNIALMSEASETGTRARLYELAYDRAIKTGLNPREAAAEAAFYAHDYMDYSRHGSTVAAWSKLVPFMNAALQGMDRYARLLVAKGDYGSAWLPYLNYRLGRTETLDLTEREKAELAQSAQAWVVSTLVMGGISMAVALLWAMRGDDDLQDVPQEIRATHWVIPLDGVYHLVPKELPGIREALKDNLDGETLRLPKGFDNAWFANLVERLMIDARQSNPRWFENYLTDLSSILNPPMEPQAIKLFYEMKAGKDFFSGRDIIPKWKQERFPEMMWDEYTSEFAKWAGKKTGTAPYYIDHALKQLGTSWARDAMSLNVPGLPWYDPTKPEKSMDDYFIARRFLWKIGKGSEAAGKVREIMGPGDPMQGVAGRLFAPYSRLDAAAETYKEYLKRRDPASGAEFLDRLRAPERAYAILDANVDGDNAKMKMVHPIHRADKVLTEVAGVQKEILGNLFESRKRKKNTGELIPLSPSEKRAAIDILTQYKMMEAHNALVVAGETGYAQRALFDTGAVMDELRAAVPDVAEEFEKRLKKAKVIPFRGVREQWPQLRQVLESAEVAALSKAGDKRGVAAKVREFYALAKTSE